MQMYICIWCHVLVQKFIGGAKNVHPEHSTSRSTLLYTLLSANGSVVQFLTRCARASGPQHKPAPTVMVHRASVTSRGHEATKSPTHCCVTGRSAPLLPQGAGCPGRGALDAKSVGREHRYRGPAECQIAPEVGTQERLPAEQSHRLVGDDGRC